MRGRLSAVGLLDAGVWAGDGGPGILRNECWGIPNNGQAGEGKRMLLLEARAGCCPGRTPEARSKAPKVWRPWPAMSVMLEVGVWMKPQEAPGDLRRER